MLTFDVVMNIFKWSAVIEHFNENIIPNGNNGSFSDACKTEQNKADRNGMDVGI